MYMFYNCIPQQEISSAFWLCAIYPLNGVYAGVYFMKFMPFKELQEEKEDNEG